ncbi:MAG: hypothetical protein JNL02_08360 [Saprospiraceae bacterium]|nr:hypothetical protein [Saprospiraceae bacterium]
MNLKLILWGSLLALTIVACKNAQKTTPAPDSAQQGSAQEVDPTFWRASHVITEEQPDSAYTYQVKKAPRRVEVPWDKLPRPNSSRRAFMATGWWYPMMAFQPSDTTVHHNFLGKWLKFREDQTFDILVKGQVVETGHWNFDDDKMIVYIACQDPYFNNSWAVQERGFRMVWKGNTEINVTGIQVRMDNSPTPPPVGN